MRFPSARLNRAVQLNMFALVAFIGCSIAIPDLPHLASIRTTCLLGVLFSAVSIPASLFLYHRQG